MIGSWTGGQICRGGPRKYRENTCFEPPCPFGVWTLEELSLVRLLLNTNLDTSHMDSNSNLPLSIFSSQHPSRQKDSLNQDPPSQLVSHAVPHFKPGTEVLDPQVAILDTIYPERPEEDISNIPLRGFLFESIETLQNASKAWTQEPHGCPSPVSSYRFVVHPHLLFLLRPPSILISWVRPL